jgi:alpha-tubulin suppressor-like RCC1 family protein
VQISAGSYCLLFLTEHTDGLQRLYMVGSLGANSDASFVPQLVDTSQVSRHGAKITKLRAGHTHALIVTGTYSLCYLFSYIIVDIGKLFGFGDNLFGQLGLETVLRSPSSLREIPFPFGIEIIDAAAGGWHSVALSDDGQVFTFGDNTFGALGRDVYGLHKTPSNSFLLFIQIIQNIRFIMLY